MAKLLEHLFGRIAPCRSRKPQPSGEHCGRTFWALHPEGKIVLCHDTDRDNILEWIDIDDEDKWNIDWFRAAMAAIRRRMN